MYSVMSIFFLFFFIDVDFYLSDRIFNLIILCSEIFYKENIILMNANMLF